ncbi:hypothetical protein [Actinospica robiniae]|nr:hypothetical protein [Actinospica robiniae]
MAAVPFRAAVTGPVPQYSDTAVVTGSLIFVLFLAVLALVAFLKRRR